MQTNKRLSFQYSPDAIFSMNAHVLGKGPVPGLCPTQAAFGVLSAPPSPTTTHVQFSTWTRRKSCWISIGHPAWEEWILVLYWQIFISFFL